MRSVVAPIFFLFGAFTIHAAGEPGIIKGADEFEFVYRVKLPEITGSACIWMPLAKTDAFQTVNVEALNIPMNWDKVQDRDYGNDICVVNAQPQDSGKTIEHARTFYCPPLETQLRIPCQKSLSWITSATRC